MEWLAKAFSTLFQSTSLWVCMGLRVSIMNWVAVCGSPEPEVPLWKAAVAVAGGAWRRHAAL